MSLKSSISQLFKTASHIFIGMSSEILEHFKHFPFPATNCFSNKGWRGRLYSWGALVRRISLVSLNDRAVQTSCSETCYIPLKSWEFPLFRHVSLMFIEMSSENLQEIEVNTFQRPIPEINRLKFPKYDLILPWYMGVANKLFRNESYRLYH